MSRPKIHVAHCAEADRDHARLGRSVAHVGHHPGVICLATFAHELPETYLLAILLHELGHLVYRDLEHTERDADHAGSQLAGVRILRRSYNGLKNLEYIRRRDLPRARYTLSRLTDWR